MSLWSSNRMRTKRNTWIFLSFYFFHSFRKDFSAFFQCSVPSFHSAIVLACALLQLNENNYRQFFHSSEANNRWIGREIVGLWTVVRHDYGSLLWLTQLVFSLINQCIWFWRASRWKRKSAKMNTFKLLTIH